MTGHLPPRYPGSVTTPSPAAYGLLILAYALTGLAAAAHHSRAAALVLLTVGATTAAVHVATRSAAPHRPRHRGPRR
jgi:hypothetical protein